MKRSHSSFLADPAAAEGAQGSESPRRPEGPTCAKDLYDWPMKCVNELTKIYGQESLVRNMSAKSGIVMTTTFSGVGSAEIAAGMLCKALRDEGLVEPGFDLHVHSVCDKDPMCRQVLMRHDPTTAPNHVFADVSDFLPDKVKLRMEALLFAAQADIENKRFPNARAHSDAIHARGEKLVRDCLNILENVPIQDQGSCYECKRNCPRFPNASARATCLWLEVAGSPCIPFVKGGAYGNGLAWVHETTIYFLSWARAMREGRPHMILHECVPGFTPETLRKCLNQREDLYQVTTIVFGPEEMGYGVRRQRRYSLCLLKHACSQLEGLCHEKVAKMLFAVPWFQHS